MKQLFHNKGIQLLTVLLFVLSISGQQIFAQQKLIKDYGIYAGNGGLGASSSGASWYGVHLYPGFNYSGGDIGAVSLVKTYGTATITSNIHSGGKINLASGNTISGNIAALNAASQSGSILTAGNNTNLTGNIDVNGSITVNSGSVTGTVTHPSGTTYSGPTPGANIVAPPSLPLLPAMPAIASFPAAGTNDITSNQSITPGAYGNLNLTGNKIITLSGPGTYVFNAINLSNNNNLLFDFQNSQNGVFKIYVHGNANLAKINTSLLNGGAASRILLESHGTGVGSASNLDAVTIANGTSGTVQFHGTIWAPYGAILMGTGSGYSQMSGALISGTRVLVNTGVSMSFAALNDCSAFNAFAGNDTSVCAGGIVPLGQAATLGVSYSWSPVTSLDSSTSSSPKFNALTAGIHTYTLTISNANCSSTDVVNIEVKALPSISINSLGALCADADSVELSASPSGGTFGGNAVSGNFFYPTLAGAGFSTVTYTVSGVNGCVNNDSMLVEVYAVTQVDASAGSSSELCINSAAITLDSSPSGGVFSGNGINGDTFDPAVAGVGTHTIVYTFNNGNCVSVDSFTITVYDLPNVSAGIDTSLTCLISSIQLLGTSSSPNTSFYWTTANGTITANENTATPTITSPGTYIATVSDVIGCSASDTAEVIFIDCILPGYTPPDGGKDTNIIGPDLTSLYQTYNGNTNPNEEVFIIRDDSVWVEIIYNDGMLTELMNRLAIAPFYATNFINNGIGNRIVTTNIHISDLDSLNDLNQISGLDIINYVRPLYKPIVSAGIAYTLGDVAQRSDISRIDFKTKGEGIKVGVISNSYNTLAGNQALIDVQNGDLPGPGNPDSNFTTVQVLQDFPYGVQSDEGRAMMQIVHDIAPKAELAFRTGFISAGDMAQGIRELEQAGCDIEVDDVTFITEPFFRDGMIAKAVNDVKALGVTYITSAGNFGSRSYEGIYTPIAPPSGITGTAHDYGGGDKFQSISLTPGSYMLVLQWEDDFFSIEQPTGGTQNDLDIYLTYDNGATLFGFNRNNLGGDPLEVLPFTVTANATTNLLVTRAAGNGNNVRFKYIFFRGAPTINEHLQGTSTIVGQANALGAITTGAVSYTNTPVYGVPSPTKASFSSTGGTMTEGTLRNKPDLCAPNGGNTTVDLGGVDIENDMLPNFFGTSASAPHVAGIVALLMECKKRFYGVDAGPDEVRNILTTTTVDMSGGTGFNNESGHGLVDAYNALKSIAKPTPEIKSIQFPPNAIPGDTQYVVIVVGRGLTGTTFFKFREDTLSSSVLNDSTITVAIPPFTGNPPFSICTPSSTPSGLDGGCSEPFFVLSPVKKEVLVKADHKEKKYGESLPVFTSTITIDGLPIDSTSYTLSDLGLDSITYNTPAGIYSNVAKYFIQPLANITNPELNEVFNYTFENGILTVHKMPLLITPADVTVQFGDKIDGKDFEYIYTYDSTAIPLAERAAFLDTIRLSYEPNLLKEVALIDDRTIYDSSTMTITELMNLSFVSGSRGIANGSKGIANGSRGIANNATPDTTYVIDLAYETLVEYRNNGVQVNLSADYLLLNGSKGIANGSKGIVNSQALLEGTALVNGSRGIANGSRGIANGSRAIANSGIMDSVSYSNTAVIIHEYDTLGTEHPDSTFALYSINAITGLTAGAHWIVPGSFMTSNFSVTYHPGNLDIQPYQLTIQATDQLVEYGTTPSYEAVISGYQYDDSAAVVLTGNLTFAPEANDEHQVGVHVIDAGGLSLQTPSNYSLTYLPGELEVYPAQLSIHADDQYRPYGFNNPTLSYWIEGFKYDDNESNAFTTPPVISTDAVVSSPAGYYDIVVSGAVAANYIINYFDGELQIESEVSCNIDIPDPLPVCNSFNNQLNANVNFYGNQGGGESEGPEDEPSDYKYAWTLTGPGWVIVSGDSSQTVTYNAGAEGTSGEFTFTIFAAETNFPVSSCSITLTNTCFKTYCTYMQSFWAGNSGADCNGTPKLALLDSILSTPLVTGSGGRKLTIGTSEDLCLTEKLPALTLGVLPSGNATCASAIGNAYLLNGKFRSALLGQTIALALAIRLNPDLGNLQITAPILVTYSATSCSNGVPDYQDSMGVSIPVSVINYMGTNNTINHLLNLMNQALASRGGWAAPSVEDYINTANHILLSFQNCRIFKEFTTTYNGWNRVSAGIQNEESMSLYPNPTSGNTSISFTTTMNQSIRLEVFDVNGRQVAKLLDRVCDKTGPYSVDIDCRSFENGIYFVRLSNGDEVTVKKLVVMDH